MRINFKVRCNWSKTSKKLTYNSLKRWENQQTSLSQVLTSKALSILWRITSKNTIDMEQVEIKNKFRHLSLVLQLLSRKSSLPQIQRALRISILLLKDAYSFGRHSNLLLLTLKNSMDYLGFCDKHSTFNQIFIISQISLMVFKFL